MSKGESIIIKVTPENFNQDAPQTDSDIEQA